VFSPRAGIPPLSYASRALGLCATEWFSLSLSLSLLCSTPFCTIRPLNDPYSTSPSRSLLGPLFPSDSGPPPCPSFPLCPALQGCLALASVCPALGLPHGRVCLPGFWAGNRVRVELASVFLKSVFLGKLFFAQKRFIAITGRSGEIIFVRSHRDALKR